MKKQYNLTHLTDELSKSVFFQEPKQAKDPQDKNQSTVAPKHQVTKALSNESATALNIQSSLQPDNQSTKYRSCSSCKAAKHRSTKAF